MDQVSTQIGKLGNSTRVITVLESFMELARTFYQTKRNTRDTFNWEKDMAKGNGGKIIPSKTLSTTQEIGKGAYIMVREFFSTTSFLTTMVIS